LLIIIARPISLYNSRQNSTIAAAEFSEASGQKVEGARGRKLFARELEAKPRRPALLARKPSRKIAFTFFLFCARRFLF